MPISSSTSLSCFVTTSSKTAIRKTCLKRRAALPEHTQREASSTLCTRIQSLDIYKNAKKIALYQAVGGEINLNSLWVKAQKDKKETYMPIVLPEEKALLFLPTTSTTPQKSNQWGILEPTIALTEAVALDEIDLMLMPLVAFDPHGTRLGRGAGYYDRTLKNTKPACLLGVAYEFQRQTRITPEPWDIPLHGIITEQNTYWSHKK